MDQQPQAPQQPQQPQPAPYQPVAPQPMQGQPVMQQQGVPMENPGQTLGIVGLVCNFLGVGIAGIVLGVMSRNKSKQVGMSTTLGTISLVWGIVETVFVTLWVIVMVLAIIFGAANSSSTGSSSTSTDSGSSFYSN